MRAEEKRKVFSSIFYPVLFIVVLWLIELIEMETTDGFVHYGLYPRTLSGLKGLIFAPLIHSDFKHLFNNSIPLLIMGVSLFYYYRKIAIRLVLMIVLAGGLWTWISARPSFHIGASGLVYGLFGFLLVSGFLRQHKALMAISFLVAFVYGSLVWGILPIDFSISYEGHFWGLMAGIVLAFYYRKEGLQKQVHHWDEDEDDDEDENAYWKKGTEDGQAKKVFIQYHVKPKEKSDD